MISLKLMGQSQFCAEMQSTLSRWHLEHEWIVTPQFVKEFGDGVSLSSYGAAAAHFLILVGNAKLEQRVASRSCACSVRVRNTKRRKSRAVAAPGGWANPG